jgi:hypothetical protein
MDAKQQGGTGGAPPAQLVVAAMCRSLQEVGLGGYRPLRSWRGHLLNTTTRTLQPPALMELPRSLSGNAETPSTEVRLLEAERNKLQSPRTTTLAYHRLGSLGGIFSAGELSRPALPPSIPPGTAGRLGNTDPISSVVQHLGFAWIIGHSTTR